MPPFKVEPNHVPKLEGHLDLRVLLQELTKDDAKDSGSPYYRNLDKAALTLMDTGRAEVVAKNLGSFVSSHTHFVDKEVAFRLIELGYESDVANNLLGTLKPDVNLYSRLIEVGQSAAVVRVFGLLGDNDYKIVFNKLLKSGGAKAILESMDRFNVRNNTWMALTLIDAGQLEFFSKKLKCFYNLGDAVAEKLIDGGKSMSLAEAIVERFPNEPSHFIELSNTVAFKLIDAGCTESVVKGLDCFNYSGRLDLVLKLIEAGQIQAISKYMSSRTINNKEINYLDSEVALRLIESGKAQVVVDNLACFKGTTSEHGLDYEVASTLVAKGYKSDVINNRNFFSMYGKSGKAIDVLLESLS